MVELQQFEVMIYDSERKKKERMEKKFVNLSFFTIFSFFCSFNEIEEFFRNSLPVFALEYKKIYLTTYSIFTN